MTRPTILSLRLSKTDFRKSEIWPLVAASHFMSCFGFTDPSSPPMSFTPRSTQKCKKCKKCKMNIDSTFIRSYCLFNQGFACVNGMTQCAEKTRGMGMWCAVPDGLQVEQAAIGYQPGACKG
jgi:hypothetical protein